MDSIMEKFSVVDFFNMIIGGFIFFLGMTVLAPDIRSYLKLDEERNFIEGILLIAVFLALSYIVGLILYQIEQEIICKRLSYQNKMIEDCLINPKVVDNQCKLIIYTKKAKKYFLDNDISTDAFCFTKEQCRCFFTYCIYYIHVRGLDWKTERMREIQNLSGILTAGFGMLSVIGFIVSITLSALCQNVLRYLIVTGAYMILTVVFYDKHRTDIRNRIRMVLAVYNASVDKENMTGQNM